MAACAEFSDNLWMTRDDSITSTLLTVSAQSWAAVALCASGCGFLGLVFFMVGLLGIVDNRTRKFRDWLLLTVGVVLLALSLSLFTLCRIAIQANEQRRRQQRIRRRRSTHPALETLSEPAAIWSTDPLHFSLSLHNSPPPAYSDALKCNVQSPFGRSEGRPPPYSSFRGNRTTDV